MQVLQTEIDARESSFHSFEASGQQQLASRHFASSEIQQKMESLQKDRALLQRSVRVCVCVCVCLHISYPHTTSGIKYMLCVKVQLFD